VPWLALSPGPICPPAEPAGTTGRTRPYAARTTAGRVIRTEPWPPSGSVVRPVVRDVGHWSGHPRSPYWCRCIGISTPHVVDAGPGWPRCHYSAGVRLLAGSPGRLSVLAVSLWQLAPFLPAGTQALLLVMCGGPLNRTAVPATGATVMAADGRGHCEVIKMAPPPVAAPTGTGLASHALSWLYAVPVSASQGGSERHGSP
jgi:hypothetical protein